MSAATEQRTDWYHRNFPNGPRHDPRCLAVLSSWQALYNIHRTGTQRLDGGFRKCSDGVEVHLPHGQQIATFDDGGLTRLVVAAHRLCCRVEVSAGRDLLILRIHPRDPDGERFYSRHPDRAALAEMALRPESGDSGDDR